MYFRTSDSVLSDTEKVEKIHFTGSLFHFRMEKPIPLVSCTGESKELAVNPEALEILGAMDKPVVVVAVAGVYRTGKSYIMNRLFGERKGFQLGSTVQSMTKGELLLYCDLRASFLLSRLICIDHFSFFISSFLLFPLLLFFFTSRLYPPPDSFLLFSPTLLYSFPIPSTLFPFLFLLLLS